MDLQGHKRDLGPRWSSVSGLAWAPSGDELWFTAATSGMNTIPRAVSLSGKTRVLTGLPGRYLLEDAGPNGRALVVHEQARMHLMYGARGRSGEQDLSWFDGSFLRALSSNGGTLIFDEEGEAGQLAAGMYVRRTDGSPPVRLGDGWAIALSPDEKWVLGRWRHTNPHRLVILPVESGEAIPLDIPGFDFAETGSWFPDSRHFLIVGRETNGAPRSYRIDRQGGAPVAVTPAGVMGRLATPDGGAVLARTGNGRWELWPIGGGGPRSFPILDAADLPLRWSTDGNYLFARRARPVPHIDRINAVSGEREHWVDISPADLGGIAEYYGAAVSGDGSRYAYCFMRALSDLFLSGDLR